MSTFTCLTCLKAQPVVDARIGADGLLSICNGCWLGQCQKRYAEICPPAYQRTRPGLLPQVAQERLPTVLDWRYGPRGLIAWGPTSGSGKTRSVWLLIQRLMCQDGVNVVTFDCIGFADELERRYRADEDVRQWLEDITNAPVLFFDDFSKLKFTERVATELYGVVDRRCQRELPILATMNEDGAGLEATVRDKRTPYLVRRLRELCDEVRYE